MMFRKTPEFLDKTDFPSAHFLQVNSCGFQTHLPGESVILRSKGRQDYHFLYVIEGSYLAETNVGVQTLLPGDLLFYPPLEKQQYACSELENSASCWVHFTGTCAADLLTQTGFERKHVFHVGKNPAFINLFERMVTHFSPGGTNLLSASYLIQFCALASKQIKETLKTDSRIAPALSHMTAFYRENQNLKFYAKLCHLSESFFSRLFREIMGISPHQHILHLRLTRAKQLLLDSNLSVAEIAVAIGFEDAGYMSRLFKKHEGISPTEYMKKWRL